MDIVQYKCPNCGANIEYSAEKQCFHCEYCVSSFSEAEIKQFFEQNESMKLDDERQKQAEEFEASTNLYSCPNCGAEVITEGTTAATFCCYCHNPLILSGRLSGDYRPSYVIPFKVDRETSIAAFKKWCGKKWFVPSDFKSEQQLEKLTGLYVPFWLADCDVDANFNAVGKNVRSWTSGNYRYTETKEYAVHRRAYFDFNGVPADGSTKVDDSLMTAIEPFDYAEFKDFSMSYLSGFIADKYDADRAAVFPLITRRVEQGGEQAIRQTVTGYSSVAVTSQSYRIFKTDWKYALLPVWFMTYKYKEKLYYFAVNGQSCKPAGLPPLSMPKLLGFCGGLFALIMLIFFGMGFIA